MQNRYKFLNTVLAATAAIPLTIVLWVCGHMLWVIWPDLDDKQKASIVDGLAIISLPGIAAACVAIWFSRKKLTIPRSTIISLIVLLIACFYLFFQYIQPTISFRDWMFDHDTYVTTLICALIPLFYFLLYYLAENFAIESRRALTITLVSSVLLPLLMYLGFNVARLSIHGNIFSTKIGHLLFISMTTAFSFVLIRLGVYIFRQKATAFQKPSVIWATQLICVGVLPFIGLALNAGGPVARESQMVLGNFTAREFWWLTGFNALLYLLPQTRIYSLNLALAGLRMAGLGFVLYFCTVFVLYLPLALLLIAAIGLGVLLLIPYITAAAQLLRLKTDFLHLTQGGKKGGVIAVLTVGFLILPAATLMHIYADRAMLTRAIEFLERPPLALNYQPDLHAGKLLAFAYTQQTNRRGRGFRDDRQNVPIYDSLYRSIVLDGADLSETIRKKIKLVFAGVDEFVQPLIATQSQAQLGEVLVNTKELGNLRESTLKITVSNDQSRDAEFNARLTLPDGALITSHWLTIDGVEVPAQITTRSNAIWIYNRITEARRDPSLIYYEAKNRLRWKIFPVPTKGFSTARLKITHQYSVDITIAGKKISLQGASVPADAPLVTRRPYLHFVVDCRAGIKTDYLKDAQATATHLGISLEKAQMSFVNTSIHTQDFSTQRVSCPQTTGGFFLDLALRSILYTQSNQNSDRFPVVVVLSPNKLRAAWEDISFLTAYYPDTDRFIIHDGKRISAMDFFGTQAEPEINIRPFRKFINPPAGFAEFYAYLLGDFQGRQRAVVHAIKTGTLNPAVGSIVLETEAQRRKLEELHKKTLNARNELDTGETPRMSEPWVYLLLTIPLFFFLWRGKKPQFPGI